MGEAKRRKKLDPNFGKENPSKDLGYVISFGGRYFAGLIFRSADEPFLWAWAADLSEAVIAPSLEEARCLADFALSEHPKQTESRFPMIIQHLTKIDDRPIAETVDFFKYPENENGTVADLS